MTWQKILYWLSGWLRFYAIPKGGPVYLERYFLFQIKWLGVTAYLHRFLDGDPGRELHNHPWDWALSILISRFYEEERADDFAIRRRLLQAPCFNLITGDTFHRVNLAPGVETWSLLIHGPWTKVWGFARFKHQISQSEWRDGLLGSKQDGPQMFDSLEFEPHPGSVTNHKKFGPLGDPWWKTAPLARDLRIRS